MSGNGEKRWRAKSAAKVLPVVKLAWDHLPPMLRLEFQLAPDADPATAAGKIQEFLQILSNHYAALGGMALRCHEKQAKKIWPGGVVRVALYPVESGDIDIQKQRLVQVEATLQELPKTPLACIHSRVA